ncbi:MAG: DUF3172 domain-containing protein [Xenococcaceae cyanobacterium]
MKRRPQPRSNYDYNNYDRSAPPDRPKQSKPPQGNNLLNATSIAIIASVFILGIVVGIALNFGTTSNPASIESRLQIDEQAPNPEVCQQFGASAMVTNMRVFITLSPFNVYVTQPTMLPGCVMRRNNWTILEQRKLVNSQQVNDCKNRMNTFGYTGTLEGSPKIECIYQNDAAGNLFLNKPGASGAQPESDNF